MKNALVVLSFLFAGTAPNTDVADLQKKVDDLQHRVEVLEQAEQLHSSVLNDHITSISKLQNQVIEIKEQEKNDVLPLYNYWQIKQMQRRH